MAEGLSIKLPTKSEKMAKAIMALIKDRKSIVGRGTYEYATFSLGNTFIQLGLKSIIVGDTKYKLK